MREHVVIVWVLSENVPHVPLDQLLTVDELGYSDDGTVHLTIRVGFQDKQDIPAKLKVAVGMSDELQFNVDQAFTGCPAPPSNAAAVRGMATWRKRLYIGLSHNAASPATYFRLPEDRTVMMGSRIVL